MRPKLIALDLDETTLDRESRLSPRCRAALEAAIRQGIEIVVATGRPIGTVPQEIKAFPGIRYAITGNGAAIYDLARDRVLRRHLLPPEAAARILEATAGEDITYEAFVEGRAYAQADYVEDPTPYLADGRTRDYVQNTRQPVPDIAEFILAHRAELDSMDLVVKDLDTKERVMDRLGAWEEVYVTTSVPRLVEISSRNSGKHRGLKFLAELLNVPQADTAAFGNADNDAEMLRWAGTGVAVANASQRCLAAADHVTAAHWDDGVARAFSSLFHIV